MCCMVVKMLISCSLPLQDITPRKHNKLMQKNRHLRYMWIPYTDSVVVVTNNRVKEARFCSACC